jgi:hypothetical protein
LDVGEGKRGGDGCSHVLDALQRRWNTLLECGCGMTGRRDLSGVEKWGRGKRRERKKGNKKKKDMVDP